MAEMSVDDLIKELRKKSKSKTRGSKKASKKVKNEGKLITSQQLGIELKCPNCGSVNYVKNGEGRYKCKDCNKSFRAGSGTILEGYDFTHNEWLDIIGCVVDRQNNNTFSGKTKYLMSRQKAWKLRIKILSAFLNMPQPILTGIIQVDGTYFRESQKASNDLRSFIYKDRSRSARTFYMPSISGIYGPEFICCIAGIDSHSHVFAKCVSLGTPTYEEFKKTLDKYIKNPSFICSDGHYLYEDYCDEYSYIHHITPSTFKNDFVLSGGIYQNDKTHPSPLTQKDIENNEKVLRKLYEDRSAPHIRNSGYMTFEAYKTIVKNQGEKYFDLQRINEFHGDLKEHLVNTSKNVSSRLLQAYIALEVYLRNFKTDYGHSCGSKVNDYEIVFNDVLKYYNYDDYKSLLNNDIVPLEYNERANKQAQKRIFEAKELFNLDQDAFERKDAIEVPNIFNKRKCFRSMSPHRINYLCRYFKIDTNNLTKTQKCDALASLPNADEVIFREIKLLYFANEEEVLNARNEGFLEKPKGKKGRPKKEILEIDNVYNSKQIKEIKTKKIICLDTETTGLESDDEIISLSIVDINGEQLYDQKFKPVKHSSWLSASKVNNIQPSDVRNCPFYLDKLNEIQKIFDEAELIVGFNLKFDLSFLKDINITNKQQIDVMELYKKVKQIKRNHKLEIVAKHYGYTWEEAKHTSLGDAKATIYCFNQLLSK